MKTPLLCAYCGRNFKFVNIDVQPDRKFYCSTECYRTDVPPDEYDVRADDSWSYRVST